MEFDNTIGYNEIITFISCIGVIVSVILAVVQWRRNSKLKRADYINDLIEKIRSDDDIRSVIYMIDYSGDNYIWYNEDFHKSGELERKVDKTLSYFSYICYLKYKKIISNDEFKFFKYEIERILKNSQVKEYFYNLYHFSEKFSVPLTFNYLFEYGVKMNIYEEEFYNKESKKYPKYLNF